MNIWLIMSMVGLLAGAMLLMFAELSRMRKLDAHARFEDVLGRKKRLHLPSPKRG
ncbi:hypothetical protein [Methylobacillus glycogenes]|uniref:hypothetical protein n=1 Tax=Methylobacillus glycogenes TaxID=406 RepID=UPI00131EF7C6|nr:hypothetical protein [Methylobacillus glycogenes]